ncbi:hypothetical protein ACIPTP_21660 [Pectobacterium versatile]|uniref:hypothetical protein n=1 Tax=Pectobacterium versatile TaxID=2488639 RepID=UPI003815D63A
MTITNADVKADFSIILQGIRSDNRNIASPLDSLLVSLVFPVAMMLTCLVANGVFFLKAIYGIERGEWDLDTYFSAFHIYMDSSILLPSIYATILMVFIFTACAYVNVLIYLSIPEDVRRKSIILRVITKGIMRIAFSIWTISVLITMTGFFIDNTFILNCFPILVFISLFVFNLYLGYETARYGLSPAIGVLSDLMKKKI